MKLRTQDAVVGAAVVLVQVLGVLSLPTDCGTSERGRARVSSLRRLSCSPAR